MDFEFLVELISLPLAKVLEVYYFDTTTHKVDQICTK